MHGGSVQLGGGGGAPGTPGPPGGLEEITSTSIYVENATGPTVDIELMVESYDGSINSSFSGEVVDLEVNHTSNLAHCYANNAITTPILVALGSKDQFKWGTPGFEDTYTVVPGNYTTDSGIADAMLEAIGTESGGPLSDSLTITPESYLSGIHLLATQKSFQQGLLNGYDFLTISGARDFLTPAGFNNGQALANGTWGFLVEGVDDLSSIANDTPTAGDVSLNSHKLTNVTPGIADTDAATVGQLGSGGLDVGAFPRIHASFDPQGATSVGAYQNILNTLLTAALSTPVGKAQGAITSLPVSIAASSLVVAVPGCSIVGVDTTNDSLNILAVLIVSNQDSTEVIMVDVSGSVAEVGPNQTGGVDWTTAYVAQIAGSDLSWNDETGVSTTAGGIFTITLLWSFTWN